MLAASPAQATCRLALLLALDVSSSVDGTEDRLQRDGVADALLDPSVRRALLATPETPVALAVYEWSGRYQQTLILPWQVLSDEAAIARAARAIRQSKRSHTEFPTALGYALGHAAGLFQSAPDCLFQTLDVSGDGITNDGFSPAQAYANFPLDNVTVNGLAIGGATEDNTAVFAYYRDALIRGPGAFVEVADDFTDFARAIREKLLREVGARVTGDARAGLQ